MSRYYRHLASASVSYLLDSYPGAQVAYSLRKLSSSYAGDAIRVRRSSDNTESDIGFSLGVLDTGSLISFVGQGNGYVTKWYDQSGNANDAVQSTFSDQPQIVSSGVIVNVNSKASISFIPPNPQLVFSTFTASAVELFLTVKAKNDPPVQEKSGFIKIGTDAFSNHFPYTNGTIYDDFASDTRKTVGNPTTPLDQLNLYNVLSASGEWTARLNATQLYSTGTNTVDVSTSPTIGNVYSALQITADLYISEMIIYPADQSANRPEIETNINNYYSLY